jgi:RHS repeat-associated protein
MAFLKPNLPPSSSAALQEPGLSDEKSLSRVFTLQTARIEPGDHCFKNLLTALVLALLFALFNSTAAAQYAVGSTVKCTHTTARVRTTTNTANDSNVIGQLNAGDFGTVQSTSVFAGVGNSLLWYKIRWDRYGVDGFTAELDGSGTRLFAAYRPPNAVTQAADNITSTTARLNCLVNANGLDTSASFQYGLSASYGQFTGSVQWGNGTTYLTSTATISGLQPNSTYHFRVVATNSSDTQYGSDLTFTTAGTGGLAPTVDTLPAENITTTSATLGCSVYTNGAPTSIYIQYGPVILFGNASVTSQLPDRFYLQSNNFSIGGLQPDTFYYYRAIASSAYGTNFGPTLTFRTLTPPGPVVSILSPIANATYAQNQSLPISWSLSGTTALVTGIRIDFLIGNTVRFTSGRLPWTQTSYSWTVPNSFVDAAAKIRITAEGSPSYSAELGINTTGTSTQLNPYWAVNSDNRVTIGREANIYSTGSNPTNTTYRWSFSDSSTVQQGLGLRTVKHTFQHGNKDGKVGIKLLVSAPGHAPRESEFFVECIGAGNPSTTSSNIQGDPINTATGNNIMSDDLMPLSARGLPFLFQAYYSSSSFRPATADLPASSPGSLGHGWSHGFETRIAETLVDGVRTCLISFGDGHAETYTQNTHGVWLSPPNVFSKLQEAVDGTFTLKTQTLLEHRFNATGRLEEIVDRNGNKLDIFWEPIPGAAAPDDQRIQKIRLPGGPQDGSAVRDVVFHYAASNPSFIWKVEDPMHHFVIFTHDGNGDLTGVTDENAHTKNYAYDARHQMLTQHDKKTQKSVHTFYNDDRKAYRQVDPSGNVMLLEYDSPLAGIVPNRATRIVLLADPTYLINDPRNQESFDIHDPKLRLVEQRVRVENPAAPGQFIWLTENWTYDEATNQLLTHTNRRRLPTTYTYSGGNIASVTTPDTGVTRFEYNDVRHPTLATLTIYPDSRVKRFNEYDAAGNLRFSTFPYDPANPTENAKFRREFTPDAFGQYTAFKDANGIPQGYDFNEWGFRWRMRDGASKPHISEFNDNGQTKASVDPRGNRADYTIDATGRITHTTSPNPKELQPPIVSEVTYDPNGDPILSKDPLNHLRHSHRDAHRRVWKDEDHEGNSVLHHFNAFGQEWKTTNAKLGESTRIFNLAGYLMEERAPAPSVAVITYIRDANGNATEVIDKDNVRVTTEYDSMDRPVLVKRWKSATEFEQTASHYNLMGQKDWDEDAAGQRTYYFYDLAGNHIRTEPKGGGPIYTFTHDNEGHQLSSTCVTSSAPTLNSLLASARVSIAQAPPDAALTTIAATSYPQWLQNRRLQLLGSPDAVVGTGHAAAFEVLSTAERLMASRENTLFMLWLGQANGGGIIERGTSTAFGLSLVAFSGHKLIPQGSTWSVKSLRADNSPDGVFNQTALLPTNLGVTRWCYNKNASGGWDLVSSPTATGQYDRIDYAGIQLAYLLTDANQIPGTQNYFKNSGIKFELNGLFQGVDQAGAPANVTFRAVAGQTGLVITKNTPSLPEGSTTPVVLSSSTTRTSYNSRYLVETQTDQLGNIESYTYDDAGNLDSHSHFEGAVLKTSNFVYDSLNRLTRINPPTGPPIIFDYDDASRRLQMDDFTGPTKWTYTTLNQVESIQQPSGLTLGFHYDALGVTDSITYPGNRIVTYLTDAAGRFESMTDWQNRKIFQTYTPADRPEFLTFPNGIKTTLGHDTRGLLNALNHRKGTAAPLYEHNPQFNHLGQLTNPPDITLTEPDGEYPRTYDAANQLATVAGSPVRHDARGNVTSAKLHPTSPVTDTLTWNHANRLTSGTIGGAVFTNVFNGQNHRVSTTRGGTTTGFLLDDRAAMPSILAETTASGTLTAFYLYVGNTLLARLLPDGTPSYYHTDHQGNVVLMTDGSGSTTAHYQYDPFGVLVASSGSLASTNHFRYLGGFGVYDNLDGTLDARARTFHPLLGRFLSRDAVYGNNGDVNSLNRYVYAGNDPLTWSDPSGYSKVAREIYSSGTISGPQLKKYIYWKDPYFYEELGQELGTRFGLIAVQSIPRVGEAMDLEDLADPDASYLTKIAAGASLWANAETGGTLPNAGGLRRAMSSDYKIAARSAEGTIYKVPGSATPSGKPYIGRHNQPEPQKTRSSTDGRDRTRAKVINTYDTNNPIEGRVKEQAAIDAEGGVPNLDNKRNEIRKTR